MNKEELKYRILKLKKEKNAIILAHNYQKPDIMEIADFIGDSLDLSRKAAEAKEKLIVFCGVRFMAETAKILAPEKMVLLPAQDAGCPMASMINARQVLELKAQYPNAKTVCYVNSTAEVKAVVDVCCTSANALSIVKNIEAEEIIFVPDENLGAYCQRFTQKRIILWKGHCYVHNNIKKSQMEEAIAKYPKAVILVHPECKAEVIDMAHEVLSTNNMLKFVKKSKEKDFIVGTEVGLIYRMAKENPGKNFFPINDDIFCYNMKKTNLMDVYYSLEKEKTKIELSSEIISAAKKSLEVMLKYN